WSTLALLGHVVKTKYHVLRWHRDRCTVGRVQDVMRSQHQQLRLQNGSVAKWKVNGHLVTVKVSVECRTDQWVQLNRLALNQFRLERLNTKTVQGRCAVEQHRMVGKHILKNIPNRRVLLINQFLG